MLDTLVIVVKALWGNLVSKIEEAARNVKNLGKEDPRRISHSLKVGLAIALVSLLYYFDPIYEGFGVSAMWAVITVVVIFEFSVGATLGKGINRGIATLVGGALGVVTHRFATFFNNDILEPIILSISVLLFSAAVSFVRFFPKLKARYDYGLLILILTFSLICVSGYREDEVFDVALTRVSTVVIGGIATVAICILICPVWAGEDLHNLVADSIEKLGNFLGGFGDEYFKTLGDGNVKDNKSLLEGYKSVINSKNVEDSLVNFAEWEPRHGKFRYRHPWGQYQKIGGLIRECAYRLDSLNGCLKSEMQTPQEICKNFQECCQTMSSESSKALKNLALQIRTMKSSSVANSHTVIAKAAANNLKILLKINSLQLQHTDLLEVIPVATVASLLVEVVSCVEKIVDSVQEFATLAKFKSTDDDDASESGGNNREILVRIPSNIEGSHGHVDDHAAEGVRNSDSLVDDGDAAQGVRNSDSSDYDADEGVENSDFGPVEMPVQYIKAIGKLNGRLETMLVQRTMTGEVADIADNFFTPLAEAVFLTIQQKEHLENSEEKSIEVTIIPPSFEVMKVNRLVVMVDEKTIPGDTKIPESLMIKIINVEGRASDIAFVTEKDLFPFDIPSILLPGGQKCVQSFWIGKKLNNSKSGEAMMNAILIGDLDEKNFNTTINLNFDSHATRRSRLDNFCIGGPDFSSFIKKFKLKKKLRLKFWSCRICQLEFPLIKLGFAAYLVP
ncbi:hypothetical protein ACH5RR_009640 [Cinchona calisaya]|uniref:Aluminum-activated malate transporter n=1 Tax=Cinchona calisaya TaxID=153742 RepID=A0ABD3AGQ7_9GENT